MNISGFLYRQRDEESFKRLFFHFDFLYVNQVNYSLNPVKFEDNLVKKDLNLVKQRL